MASLNLKLTYFNIAGRAEPIRLALHMGGIEFEDERISPEEFRRRKPELPSGQLPILQVGDTVLSQSHAILRYAGRLSGLYPEELLAAAKVDVHLGMMEDVLGSLSATMREPDNAKKMAMREKIATETMPKHLELLANALLQEGGIFFGGNGPNVADLLAMQICNWVSSGVLDGIPTNILETAPTMKHHLARMRNYPKIAEYYAARSTPKLVYFDIPGRAEPIRLAFHLAGVPFTDQRLAREEFAALKPTLPFGQLPVLELGGGAVLSQSQAILKYVGQLGGGLYPREDPLAAAGVDAQMGLVEDVWGRLAATLRAPDDETRMAMRAALCAEGLPPFLNALENALTAAGGEFLGGAGPNVADLMAYQVFNWMSSGILDGIPANYLDDFLALKAHLERLKAYPKIAEYLESRKK